MQSQNSIISFLQAFGILLVVVGHSFYGCPDNPIHTWIYSFHMPLFMFISGYLLKYTMSIKGNQLTENTTSTEQEVHSQKNRTTIDTLFCDKQLGIYSKNIIK